MQRSVVCSCAGVSHAQLSDAIEADPRATADSLGARLGCGLQCGSCIPAIHEALGQAAWFAATALATAITRSRPLHPHAIQRQIYRVDLALQGDEPYPLVQPGQHIVLRGRTLGGDLLERTYTVVAQDVAARRLAVAIRRKPGGRFSPWLLTAAGQPRAIEVSAPGGAHLRVEGPCVFFAAGVGVTPAVSMMHALQGSATLHLDYSVHDKEDAAFASAFDARARNSPGFSWNLRETSTHGPIGDSDVQALVTRFRSARFFICGPEGYIDRVNAALRRAQVKPSRIHVERFAMRAPPKPFTFRARAYLAGAVLAALPFFVLSPAQQDMRPHGHSNVGHEQVKCDACHADTGASTRQALQAKAKHLVGLRQTGAVLGKQPVSNAGCVQCHANSDDRHPPHRFFEPRFERARAEVGAQQCVSCHREHSGVRVTSPTAGFCVSCHSDMKVKGDRAVPTHGELVRDKRWDTCLRCHDYHGNHSWRAPRKLADAASVAAVASYLGAGPSPYGATVVKAKKALSP